MNSHTGHGNSHTYVDARDLADMGILDTQSIRLSNRRLGKRRLEQRRAARKAAAAARDRRRPGRGARTRSHQDTTVDVSGRRRRRSRARLRDSIGGAGRVLLMLLLLPVQLLLLLLRPLELIRRLRETPGRVRSASRRLRMASRDPRSRPGRAWQTARLSAHFVREELADMQDGFPRPTELALAVLEVLRELAARAGRAIGVLPRDRRDDVSDRLLHALSLGVISAAVLVGLFVASYQGIEAAKTSDRLAIKQVRVLGLERTPEEAVLARLPVAAGDNLLDLDLATLGRGARDLPWIDDVTVTRNLRDGLLTVRVVEHRPVFLMAGADLRLVDDQGRPFKPLDGEGPADLPVLALAPDLGPDEQAHAATGALEILRALAAGRALTATDVSEVRYDPDDGFALVTRGGLPVRLGRRDFADRLGRLERAVHTGSLPLDALASVDVGLRDRLVAVPLTTRKAERQIRKRVEEQPIDQDRRRRMLHLERIRRSIGSEGGAG